MSTANLQQDAMMISSNPTRGLLRVRYHRPVTKGKLEVALLDHRGDVLDAPVRLVGSNAEEKSVEFAIQHDHPGMYFVRIKDGKKLHKQRVSLQ